MSVREISKIVTGTPQVDGAGVKLVRVLGYANVWDFDPFLMLDAFDSKDPSDYIKGFPWHPHRGIETITYLIHGEIEHGDSMGNKGLIQDGGCQWMTAGKAILHQEMPQPSEQMLGVQVWLNLPKKNKMVPPQYRDLRAELIPVVEEENCRIGIISGHYMGQAGATQGDYVKATFLDVDLSAESKWSLSTNSEETVFIYVVDGVGIFGGNEKQLISAKKAILFDKGDELTISSGKEKLRMFVFSGKPLREAIAWGGPIVMNTDDELDKAFKEIREGTFGR
ncbi:MAG: Pirin domain protein [Herbinix sp.]|jgi:redox-sensitive bicupin YhaK (pirin superfamily)|nr:Pirin domain protein [Herbinix sp.]